MENLNVIKNMTFKRLVVLLLCLAPLIASVSYAVQVGVLTPQQGYDIISQYQGQIDSLQNQLDTVNTELANVKGNQSVSWNPTYYVAQSEDYAYTVSALPKTGGGYYYCLANGSTGQLIRFSTDKTVEERCAQGNLTGIGGKVGLKEITYDTSLQASIPVNVVIVESYQGIETRYTTHGTLIENAALGTAQFYYDGSLAATINMTAGTMTLSSAWSQITNANVTVQQIVDAFSAMQWKSSWNTNVISALLNQNVTVGNIDSTQPIALYSYMIYNDPVDPTLYKAKAANGTVVITSTNCSYVIDSAKNSLTTGR